MTHNDTVKSIGLTILSVFIFVLPLWSQDFCGEGNMWAILDTIPPCHHDSGYGNERDHYGDVTVTLVDCGTGETLGTIEQAMHMLPVCPQPPSGGGTFPSAGVDTIFGTNGEIYLTLIIPPVTETLIVGGDMRILRSDPDSIDRHIETEIISMELTGTSPNLGPIRVRAGVDYGLAPSLGNIQPLGISDYPAYSTFDISFEITSDTTGIEEKGEKSLKRKSFILHEITPNPLSQIATIRFGLVEPGWVSLKVYNLRGERVKTLVEGNLNAGLHRGIWDLSDKEGKEVSSGVYFYQLTTRGISETKRLILIR